MARKEGQTGLHIAMSKEELEAVRAIANRRGYKITADYIRALITEDAAHHGETITFAVDRGGDRRLPPTP